MKNLFLVICIYVVGFSTNGIGQVWNSVGIGVSNQVYCTTIDSVNDVFYVGGRFAYAGGLPALKVASWNGNSWFDVGGGMNNSASAGVSTLCFFNGELYAAGNFDSAGNVQANNIAKWNGSNWSALGDGFNYGVNCLIVYNGELYAGGNFTASGNNPLNFIAKWNGSTWIDVGGGTNQIVMSFCAFGNDLYVGGYFNTAGSSTANRVAKWNGSSWSGVGQGFNSVVRKLHMHNGELFAAGDFTSIPNNQSNYISKLVSNSWQALPSFVPAPNRNILDLASYNGELYLTGNFDSPHYIAKFDGVNYDSLGVGLDWIGSCLAVYKNELYVGGYFLSAGNINNTSYLARWSDSVGESEVISPDELTITPNPFQIQTTFNFPECYLDLKSFKVLIFDELGRVIKSHTLEKTRQFILERNNMVSGIYYYKVMGLANETLAYGKIIVI